MKTIKPLLLLVTLCLTTLVTAQTDTEKAAMTVDKNEIEGHIYFLAVTP